MYTACSCRTLKSSVCRSLISTRGSVSAYFLARTDGWLKDGDLNTAFSQTVEPLPFHGMSRYPYGDDESYPLDKDHQDYLAKYNTRKVTPEEFRTMLSRR